MNAVVMEEMAFLVQAVEVEELEIVDVLREDWVVMEVTDTPS